MLLWGKTMFQQFELLAGKSAPREFLQLVIYKAMTFSDEIQQIDTVRAYHVSRPARPLLLLLTGGAERAGVLRGGRRGDVRGHAAVEGARYQPAAPVQARVAPERRARVRACRPRDDACPGK